MYMYKLLRYIKNTFPKTQDLIIIFSNVISFMTLQTCFFWYVASFKIENIIDSKSKFIKDILYIFPETFVLLNNYTQSDMFLELKKEAESDKYRRDEYNTELLITWMIPPFIGMLLLLIGCIIECYIHKKKFDRTDKIILSMVLMSVFTEVIFYFVVIFRSEILADMEILKIILDKVGVNDIITVEQFLNILNVTGTHFING